MCHNPWCQREPTNHEYLQAALEVKASPNISRTTPPPPNKEGHCLNCLAHIGREVCLLLQTLHQTGMQNAPKLPQPRSKLQSSCFLWLGHQQPQTSEAPFSILDFPRSPLDGNRVPMGQSNCLQFIYAYFVHSYSKQT